MNGLTSIEINGQTIGLKFGLESNRIFFQGIADHLLDVNQGILTEKDIGLLIHSGYVNFCTTRDLIPDSKYSLGSLIDWAEENMDDEEFAKEVHRISIVFRDSKHTKATSKKIVASFEEEIKKKMKQTGSSLSPTLTENLELEVTENSQI